MPGSALFALLVGLAVVFQAASAEPYEERDALWRGVLGYLGGNTAE